MAFLSEARGASRPFLPPDDRPGLPLKWTSNLCHFHTGFFEPLVAALCNSGQYDVVVEDLRYAPANSVSDALRRILLQRFDSNVSDRSAPLTQFVSRLHTLGLCPAIGTYWTPDGWLSLLQAEGFGGHFLRETTCARVTQVGPCSERLCQRSLLRSVTCFCPSLATNVPRGQRLSADIDFGAMVQNRVDEMLDPKREGRVWVPCSMAWMADGGTIVECVAGCNPPFKTSVELPRILFVRVAGHAAKETARFKWKNETFQVSVHGTEYTYRVTAIVLYQNSNHYICLVRFGSRWFLCEYSKFEPFEMKKNVFAAEHLRKSIRSSTLAPFLFVFNRVS